jgi:hypothetical protein
LIGSSDRFFKRPLWLQENLKLGALKKKLECEDETSLHHLSLSLSLFLYLSLSLFLSLSLSFSLRGGDMSSPSG